jgi:hypothetical protein
MVRPIWNEWCSTAAASQVAGLIQTCNYFVRSIPNLPIFGVNLSSNCLLSLILVLGSGLMIVDWFCSILSIMDKMTDLIYVGSFVLSQQVEEISLP